MPLKAGSRIGMYEILAPLGAGGMGEVYRARDLKLSRDVAIKVLPEATAANPQALSRFHNEARAVAALSHSNILAIHDFGNEAGVAFAVMELLEGESLRKRLDRGPIPLRRAAEIARGIAQGLAAAHQKGIVHRDLKPENLFLTKDGAVKILDFGLARPMPRLGAADSTLTARTEPGALLGTVGYMSPEQVRGEPADERSDIFSFGTVLYEMFSGLRAFKGDTSVETMNAILREEPPPLSESGRPVPPALERLVGHCLEKEPGDRFQSARDLAFDLGNLSTESSAPGGAPSLAARRRWARILAFIVSATALVAAGVWAGARFGPKRHSTDSPTIRRLTFRRGLLQAARFAPDGRTVIYGAEWEGKPTELFSVRTDTLESHSLGSESAGLASVSHQGELAILIPREAAPVTLAVAPVGGGLSTAMLARVPIGGGAPRKLLDGVVAASWGSGENLAAVVAGDTGIRLEYPLGTPLRESLNIWSDVRVSPDGKSVATLGLEPEKGLQICVTERQETRCLARAEGFGLAWSADSKEIYFVGGPTRQSLGLRAVNLSGRQRVLMPLFSAFDLQDAALDGRMLIHKLNSRVSIACRPRGAEKEREIGWLDRSDVRDLSDDGRFVLFSELGDGGQKSEAYVRPCDGSPAIRLGDGVPLDISPDGQWAAVVRRGPPPEVFLLPTGPGSPRKVPVTSIRPHHAKFGGQGRGLLVFQEEKGALRWEMVADDGRSHPSVLLPDYALDGGSALSPDGLTLAYTTRDRKLVTASVLEGRLGTMPGPPLRRDEQLLQWSEDGRFLYIALREGPRARIFRREIATARTEPWLELQPANAAGIGEIALNRDGQAYAYTYLRVETSDLYIVEGLH